MGSGVAALAIAIALIAVPTPGVAPAMDAGPPCCWQRADAPCQTGEAACTSLAAATCCDVAPAAPASQTKSSIDAPSLHRVASAMTPGVPVPSRVAAPRVAENLTLLTSPLRLSVVLLI